jgi:hypothetical protein
LKASVFAATYGPRGFRTWEAAFLDLVKQGTSYVLLSFLPVQLEWAGHTGVVLVSADYLCVGEPDDYMRLPLTPTAAQEVADVLGLVLSTPRITRETWQQAPVKLVPIPAPALPSHRQNMGADMNQYVEHDQAVSATLRQGLGDAAPGSVLASGQKKDVVISSIMKPGKVVIYGWFQPSRVGMPCKADGTGQPTQCLSNVHGDFYVDYSHGIRLVQPSMTVDGRTRDLRDVLQDKAMARLVNDEGVCPTRYPTPGLAPVRGRASGLADLGTVGLRERHGSS